MARLSALPGTGLLGIGTSKKIGNKPRRNRTKRRFREAVRLSELVDPRLDYVLIVGPRGDTAPFARIREEVVDLFGKARERWADELACS